MQYLDDYWLIISRYNWTARKLHKRLEQLGAQEFYPRGEGDEQHEEGSVAPVLRT